MPRQAAPTMLPRPQRGELSDVNRGGLVLGLALVLLLGIPWGVAVAGRLANGTDSPTQ